MQRREHGPDPGAAAVPGDAESFQRLVRPHVAALHALAARVLGDPEAADDAVQEALLRAWQAFGELRERAALRAWLLRIALRAAQTRAAAPRRVERSLDELAALPAGVGLDPQHVARERELADRLGEALERLPARQRAALHLRAHEGLDYAAIAAVLECSRGAARMLVLEARRRVRARLGEHLEP